MELKIGQSYRLYAKDGDMRYAPMDMARGTTVGNLIYATIYNVDDDADIDAMTRQINDLHADNPTWKFEYRKV